MVSVNTNYASLLALQQLSQTQGEIETTLAHLSTGLDVGSAKDDGATYALALEMRSDVASYGVVGQSLERAISVVDIAIATGEALSDLLVEMKNLALAGADSSITDDQRQTFNEEFQILRDQTSALVASAEIGGVNLLDGSSPDGISALANRDGTREIKIEGFDFSNLAPPIEQLLSGQVTVPTSQTKTSQTQSKDNQADSTNKPTPTQPTGTISSGNSNPSIKNAALLSAAHIDTTINTISRALGKLGASAKVLDSQHSLIVRKSDILTASIGNLIDADIGREAARLKSLQTKQALGVQSLAIANSTPSLAISLLGSAWSFGSDS